MLLLDVNVILAIHRGDLADHESARAWFESVRGRGDRFTVPALVWASFLRIATSRKIFPIPTPRDAAFEFIEAIQAQPGHVPVSPGPLHLSLLRELCDEAGASGDLIPDAVIAALAAEHACEIVTFDRDFARFPSVPHRRPGAE